MFLSGLLPFLPSTMRSRSGGPVCVILMMASTALLVRLLIVSYSSTDVSVSHWKGGGNDDTSWILLRLFESLLRVISWIIDTDDRIDRVSQLTHYCGDRAILRLLVQYRVQCVSISIPSSGSSKGDSCCVQCTIDPDLMFALTHIHHGQVTR